jgi:hypothetical protein
MRVFVRPLCFPGSCRGDLAERKYNPAGGPRPGWHGEAHPVAEGEEPTDRRLGDDGRRSRLTSEVIKAQAQEGESLDDKRSRLHRGSASPA